GLKTDSNNPDAALTPKGQGGRNLRVFAVYVLSQRGKPLMPCSPWKARKLLDAGKVRVVSRTPFVIQLTSASGETVQPVTLGLDPGYAHVGLSAISDGKELYAADVQLRTDIVKLNAERTSYRRTRRSRKTWYRKPRFLNRKKSDGWLAPSIQHKLDSTIRLVEGVKKILPLSKAVVEVAAFDIQRIKNPEIAGVGYQQGEQAGFWNVREYVLFRDGHTCQHCKGKSKDPILNVHHIESRQTGGDRPENLITLCKTCHDQHHHGAIRLKVRPSKGFKAEAFMTMVRWRLVNRLREMGYATEHTYGYRTKSGRIALELPKSHVHDAFVIAGGNGQKRLGENLFVQQVRKCNRKLFKGARSHIKNTAPRYVKGFQRFDKVRWNGIECFVFGRRSTGYFELRDLDGNKIHASAKAKECVLLESAKTHLLERKDGDSSRH
ncbi:MAG: RNA-guided endonuclease IscB, partial [Desulfobacteraceae bacterium]|nr:RNA-guided endonuclease IscB [Desulfobacteraceae bacterium]